MDRHELLSRLRPRPDANAHEIAAAIEVVEASLDAGLPTPEVTAESAAHPDDVAFTMRGAHLVTR